MESIELTEIKVFPNKLGGGKVEYHISAPEKYLKWLKNKKDFLYIEYPSWCGNISNIPEAILTIPFVGNVITVSMGIDLPIKVKFIDKTFYDSLPKIRDAYHQMFPYMSTNFDVIADNVVNCNYLKNKEANFLFFTGGLDATSALVEKVQEKPVLVNIWGGDVSTKDLVTHDNLDIYFSYLKERLNVEYFFIKSNCREMYRNDIGKLYYFKILPWQNHGWWSSIAHIISMSTLLAPIAYKKNFSNIYIGSSYETDRANNCTSNNEKMLNSIKFASGSLKSVDPNLSRLEKANKIINFATQNNIDFKLKVCWYTKNGENCSNCEKCYRTILDIYLNHGDPNKFGFTTTDFTFKQIKNYIRYNFVTKDMWNQIKEYCMANKEEWKNDKNVSWLIYVKINGFYAILQKIKSTIKKVFNR